MAESNPPDGYAPFDLYPYNPARPPAYIFIGLFGLSGFTHLILMFPYRAVFPLPMVIGCFMESAGYYFRSTSHNNQRKIMPFVIQHLLLLAAPPLLAATLYMSPKRIMRALDCEEFSLISTRFQTKLFVLVDLVCFGTQVAGAIMSGSENLDEAERGKTIVVAGLVLQIVAFVLFIGSNIVLQVRLRRSPSQLSLGTELKWQRYILGLHLSSVLFLVRNIVRILEFKQGNEGVLATSEALLYVFDSCFMWAIVVSMLVFHPGRLVKKAGKLAKEAYLMVNMAQSTA